MHEQSSTAGKNIYLAGKITPWSKGQEDWRFALVPSLTHTVCEAWVANYTTAHGWPTLPQAILGKFNYVGPFFTDLSDEFGGHGGPLSYHHGINDEQEHKAAGHGIGRPEKQRDTITRCLQAITRADMVFAWVETLDCYGTLFELGFAKGLGKPLAVYIPFEAYHRKEPGIFDDQLVKPFADLWFMQRASNFHTAHDPVEAFQHAVMDNGWLWLQDHYDSPLEQLFAGEWVNQALHLLWALDYQHPVKEGAYRLDFAYEPAMLGIELDGYTYHSDRDAFTRDRKRQREIEALGWSVIRFSGDELRQDIASCVRETARRLDLEKRKRS